MASSNFVSIYHPSNYSELHASSDINERFADGQTKAQNEVSGKQSRSWWMLCLNLVVRIFRLIKQRRIERETCLYLLSLDDCFLNDIGVNRADVVWAMRQKSPLVSASAELEKIVRGKRDAQIRNQNYRKVEPSHGPY